MTESVEKEVTLSHIPEGHTARVLRIKGGRVFQSRLIGMGIRAGITVNVIQNNFTGPVILGIHHGRLALGHGMAERILVSCEK